MIATVLCGLVLSACLVYFWQPYRYDLFPRQVPRTEKLIDPDSTILLHTGTRVAVVTAHPDDSEFYLAGTLTKLSRAGAEISLILCTSGNRAYNPFKDHDTMKRTRHGEQLEAAKRYNTKEVVFLDYPDGRLSVNEEVIGKVVVELRRIQPDYLLIFDSIYPPRLSHRDHLAAGEIGERAAGQVDSWKWLMRFSTSAPNFAVDVTPVWEEIEQLLLLHKSEFDSKRDRILALIRGQAASYGELILVPLAEGFRCSRRP